jgi:uncharacterized protein YggU (UPF0235/DUF167 family)
MPLSLREKNDGLIFKIHVQPRSSRNKVTGAYDDALKVMLRYLISVLSIVPQ